ncbi:MAG: zinc-ribbon domain-containing protein, partial [Oscillospiraceae bacterium]
MNGHGAVTQEEERVHNCKDCGAELREEFNLCPYCGFPTDKIIKELEELKGIVDENSTPEEILSAIAASAAQMTVTMQTPDEVLASKEQEPVLSAAMPTPEGKEFGGPQMGSLERAQREVDAKKNSGKSEDTKDLKSYFNRRNVVGMLLALIVIVCMVVIIFFNNVMEPDLQMELGNDYLTAEKYDKAEKAFTNVLKQDANNADAITKL